jgi:hypothetical protein
LNDSVAFALSLESLNDAMLAMESEAPEGVSLEIASSRLSNGSAMPVPMAGVMADRRFARLYEILDSFPVDLAADEAKTIYDRQLENLSIQWNQEAHLYRDAKSQVFSVVMHRQSHALACAIVLCSRFCPPQDALPLVKQWDAKLRKELSDTQFSINDYERRHGVPLMDVIPDSLFELNHYAILAARLPSEELTKLSERQPLRFPVAQPWNVLVSHARRPRDGVLTSFPLIKSWGPIQTPEAQALRIQEIYTALEKSLPSAAKGDTQK